MKIVENKSIADCGLGRLARYLRMTGFDTLYRNDFPDDEIIKIAVKESGTTQIKAGIKAC